MPKWTAGLTMFAACHHVCNRFQPPLSGGSLRARAAYRTALLGVRSIDPMMDYLPSMIESLRSTILRLDLFSEDDLAATLAECRQHLAKPGTAFTMYTLAQVWGRTA
jgi:hypothetical protein